jgi:hypothetical protein
LRHFEHQPYVLVGIANNGKKAQALAAQAPPLENKP